MSKEIISLSVASTLSLAVIIGVFSWLDGTGNLSSDVALAQAKQSLSQICNQKGISAAELELVDATAPSANKHGWQFKFQAPGSSAIVVEVADNGNTKSISPL